jgi:tRNA threonylcarbamoyladenosine biosynthesis protein TsaB
MSFMNILAFDTSASACSIALQKGEEIHCLHKIAPMQQAKLILPMIESLLAKTSLTLDDLDFIAYGRGPGSFTGIRIANTVAQGLAFAAKKPLVAISSLAILAETVCMKQKCRQARVVVDARMGQVYWADYEIGHRGHVELRGVEQLSALDALNLPETDELPCAEALLPLARIDFEENQWISAADAVPVYLR